MRKWWLMEIVLKTPKVGGDGCEGEKWKRRRKSGENGEAGRGLDRAKREIGDGYVLAGNEQF